MVIDFMYNKYMFEKVIVEYMRYKLGNAYYKKNVCHQIVVYESEKEKGYEASYKCIPAYIQDVNAYVYEHFQITSRVIEYVMFQTKEIFASSTYPICLLSYQDEEALEIMKQSCAYEEIQEATLSVYDLHPIGIYIDTQLVGMCSVIQEGCFYDIGILVHPCYRHQGIATSLLLAMCEWIKTKEGIAIYRVDKCNEASYKTALKVGFHVGIQKSIYEIKEM